MAFFFATGDDLLPVLLSVEARHTVVYTPFKHVNEPSPTLRKCTQGRMTIVELLAVV